MDKYADAIVYARSWGFRDGYAAEIGAEPDLSGEWAGDLSGPQVVANVLAQVDLPPDGAEFGDWFSDICDAYEDAFYSGNATREERIVR